MSQFIHLNRYAIPTVLVAIVIFLAETHVQAMVCEELFLKTPAAKASQPKLVEDIDNLIMQTERLTIEPIYRGEEQLLRDVFFNRRVRQKSGDQFNENNVAWIIERSLEKLEQVKEDVEDGHTVMVTFKLRHGGKDIGVAQLHSGYQERGHFNYNLLRRPRNDHYVWISISYMLKPAYWGKGFATEAAHRLIRFAFEEVGAGLVHAQTIKRNVDSQNVLTKLGFKPIGRGERVTETYEVYDGTKYVSMPLATQWEIAHANVDPKNNHYYVDLKKFLASPSNRKRRAHR